MNKLAAQAYEIITTQQLDYFESESEAQEHARFERVDPKSLSKTELGYTQVPREYPHSLELRLADAFNLLGSTAAQDFLHIDRHAVTLGRTIEGNSYDTGIDLLIPSHQRSCSLRLRSADTASFGLQPQQPEGAVQVEHDEPIELTLGRNVILANSWGNEYSRSVRDSFRDWERVLVVGDAAIRKYIYATWYEKDEHIADKQQAARIGQVGFILASEEALSLGTDFRNVLGDRSALERALNSIP